MAWLIEDQHNASSIWWSLLSGEMYPDIGPTSFSNNNFVPDHHEAPGQAKMAMPVPAGAIGARSAMLGKVHLRKPRKRASNVSTLTGAIPNELGVPPFGAKTPRSGSPSPTRSPSTHSAETVNLDPDHYLQEEEKAAEDDESEPQIYLSRRYGLEVSAKDAALAAEQWKKSQTDEEKLSRKQRQRREHE
nr:uncharacterized protein LOC129278363 [Lytechinus pictus]